MKKAPIELVLLGFTKICQIANRNQLNGRRGFFANPGQPIETNPRWPLKSPCAVPAAPS
jgi:hypothetical protein